MGERGKDRKMPGTMVTELPPLAALVKEKHDAGRSYREMAAAAQRAGYDVSHSQMQAYATNQVRKAPSNDQLEALAAALSVSVDRVRTAMMQQFYGYVPKELAVIRESPVSAAVPPDLSPDEEQELARLVAAWVEARRRD